MSFFRVPLYARDGGGPKVTFRVVHVDPLDGYVTSCFGTILKASNPG